MPPTIDYSLYLVTDRDLMSSATIEDCVTQALLGGATVVQLREKNLASAAFVALAANLREVTAKFDVALIINDRVDIALAVDADGVHVGQEDLPAEVVRRLIGPDRIMGVSVSTLAQAQAAAEAGADYLGVGAMFATNTKNDAQVVTMDELRRIRDSIDLPIVVIGGINQTTIPGFRGIGIDGVAVVSALIAPPNVEAAARKLRAAFQDISK